MRLLLDTHVLLWWLDDNPKLGRLGRALIEDPANDPVFSIAAIWEMAIKVGQHRLEVDLEEALGKFALANFARLDVAPKHLVTVSRLARIHGDPFDRMMIAQAMCEAVVVMTDDALMKRYPVRTVGCR